MGTVESTYSLRRVRYVEKNTREFAVQARIAAFVGTIGASLTEIGFTFDSFTSSASTLRCSCGWGRLVCVMMVLSHVAAEENIPVSNVSWVRAANKTLSRL